MCTVLLPPGDNPIAVNKYININIKQIVQKFQLPFPINLTTRFSNKSPPLDTRQHKAICNITNLQCTKLQIHNFPSWPNSPPWGRASLHKLHDHTTTHHIRFDSSGRVISPPHRPLPANTQHSQQTDIHAFGKIRTHNPSKRAAADPRLRPRGHWDRLQTYNARYK